MKSGLSTMSKEMGVMECMNMMSLSKEMMSRCCDMMMGMGKKDEAGMMTSCMEMMTQAMSMMKDMNMTEAAMKMMSDCMTMMMKCMENMMMAMGMMPGMKESTMMGKMEMMMKEMKMMMAAPMDIMACMNMMQMMKMMQMDMEMEMSTSNMEMQKSLEMMDCLCMLNQSTMMMCQACNMMNGKKMPMMTDMKMAEMGMNEIRMAEMEMSGLMALRMEFGKMKPFNGMKIACSMHVTVQTAVMLKTMMMMGAEVRCCACNMNSTQNNAAAAMNMMGIPTFGMRGMSMDEMIECMEMCMFLDGKMTMPVNMIMDTTGMMTKMMMEKHPMMMEKVIGVCMDSLMGMQMMNKMMKEGQLMMPVMNMNTSPRKARIDYKYGSMESLITSLRNLTGMMIAGKVCVVAGYGDMGKACADAMKMAGARVIVTEIDPFCALQACMDGCMVMKMEDACKTADIIVTATENRDAVTEKHFKLMKNNCMVCNMSDYDSEIDMTWLNKNFGDTKMTMKPMVDMYTVEGKNIMILGEGSAINMACSMGYSSFVMSACFSIQLMAMMEFYMNNKMYEPKTYKMPVGLGVKAAKMHLSQLGIELDTLSPEQEACMMEMQMMTMPEMVN
ncbi:MAG TPA: adenosylhomocysteinase [Cytophagaceae bacterium]